MLSLSILTVPTAALSASGSRVEVRLPLSSDRAPLNRHSQYKPTDIHCQIGCSFFKKKIH